MPDEAKTAQTQQPKTAGNGWALPYAALLENNRYAFAHWVQDAMALSQEISRFIQERLQEDVAASVALTTCRSATDVMGCQRRFATKAAEQYSVEINKLSQMMMKVTTAGFTSLAENRPPARR
jgi:Phasin protein